MDYECNTNFSNGPVTGLTWSSVNSPSARPGKKIGAGYPVDRIFFGTNRRINICRIFIQVLYSAKICGK